MTVEYRTIRPEEFERFSFITAYSFNGDRAPEAAQRLAEVFPTDWCLAAFDHGEMVANLRIIPFVTRVNGGSLPMGGIAAVGCLPEHRRRGYVGGLLRKALEMMRERGQVLSGLYTPHFSLYRRYGWEISAMGVLHHLPPKQLRVAH